MATNTFPTQLQFSIHVHLVPCLLSELSLKSLLFISSTKFCCYLLKKKKQLRLVRLPDIFVLISPLGLVHLSLLGRIRYP